jgi:protein involved in plasmid replication-relaxation
MVVAMFGRLDLVDRVVHGFRSAAAEQQSEKARAERRTKRAGVRDHPRQRRGSHERRRDGDRGRRSDSVGDELGQAATSALGSAWRTIRLPLLLVGLGVASSAALRTVSRRRRLASIVRFEVRPSREDIATPYQREKLFDAWHGQLCPRWWTRLVRGPPSVALELHQVPAGQQVLMLAATAREARMIEGRLAATYPDVTLVPADGGPSWARHVIRLKKRRVFVARIQTVKDDEQALVESIVTTMASVSEPASVQLVLTPAPWLAHRLSRWLLKLREQKLTREERSDGANIGVDSVVEDKELKGALETQHRSLFWAEIRVASDSREAARALAGLFSEAHSENALVQRNMRLRRALYARRIALAAANLLPSFLHGVLSSSELAAIWSLPRQRIKATQLARSPLRRAPAPPEITRDPELELMRDERGPVGLLPEDLKYGLALIGATGVGKSTEMAWTIKNDARDRDAAMVLADLKEDTAQLALELIPEDRTVWFMDLARPEVGINPLRIAAEPSAVADVILQAMREVHEPGAILSQSDEFLRNAALAICAAEPEPTLWHMYELLSPRRDDYRKEIVERLRHRPGLGAVERYWRNTFPERWMDSRTHMAGQLAAPLNKIGRLLATPSVDLALRHPFALDISRVIRERQVLIVSGALGEVGEQNAIVVMQLILQLVHQAMKQQQRLPVEERVRVCLKVDEAHLVLTPSFATMLALHRAAGPLEVTAAWQYSEQVADPSIRSGLKSLLRSRSMFAMGEVADAREQAEVAMEVYSDLIRSEHDDRERMRFGPDDVVRLPTFCAINSWVAGGARQSAFVARTRPPEGRDPARREHHLKRQREEGAFYPGALPDPIENDERPRGAIEVDTRREGGGESETKEPAATDEHEAIAATEIGTSEAHDESPADAEAQEAEGAEPSEDGAQGPDTYLAVHRQVVRLTWDGPKKDRGVAERLEPQPRDLEILRALWRYEALLLSQIWREWWGEKDIRAAQQRLKRLAAAGWLRRFSLRLDIGAQQPGYVLARPGFVAGQNHRGPNGSYIPRKARWRERRLADHSVLGHLLQTNAWVLAYRRQLGEHAIEWRGEPEGRLEAPTKLAEGRRVAIGADDIELERYSYVRDLKEDEFGRVWPDATLTLDMPRQGRRFDLMIELDRTQSPAKNLDKFRRYDALITAWWRRVERYRRLGEAPAAVFVCVDEEHVLTFAHAADQEVTGRLGRPGTSDESWPYPGRERMLFVSERDVHEGSLRAWKLPVEPSRGRGELELREVRLPGRNRGGG